MPALSSVALFQVNTAFHIRGATEAKTEVMVLNADLGLGGRGFILHREKTKSPQTNDIDRGQMSDNRHLMPISNRTFVTP
jgi:hypothetical protein